MILDIQLEAIRQKAKNDFSKAKNLAEMLMRYEDLGKELRSEFSSEQIKNISKVIAEEFKLRMKDLSRMK